MRLRRRRLQVPELWRARGIFVRRLRPAMVTIVYGDGRSERFRLAAGDSLVVTCPDPEETPHDQ